jgi:hypothetical protein
MVFPMLYENPTNPTSKEENLLNKGNSGFDSVSGLRLDPTPAREPDTAADRVSGYEPYVGFPVPNPTSEIGLVMRKTKKNVGFVGFRKREVADDQTVDACAACPNRAVPAHP